MGRRSNLVKLTALLTTGLALGAPCVAPVAHADDPLPLHRLVDTAAQRLATADPVAAYKWIDGGPITDPARAGQVLDAVGADAVTHGIDPDYVRTIFENQIGATEAIEYTRFGQWKFDPTLAPTAAPDLSESRAAIDGFNKLMVDEIALQRDALHGPSCAAELGEATEAVAAARQLDGLYRQALTSATRSYCTT
jgi:chorismate mutase